MSCLLAPTSSDSNRVRSNPCCCKSSSVTDDSRNPDRLLPEIMAPLTIAAVTGLHGSSLEMKLMNSAAAVVLRRNFTLPLASVHLTPRIIVSRTCAGIWPQCALHRARRLSRAEEEYREKKYARILKAPGWEPEAGLLLFCSFQLLTTLKAYPQNPITPNPISTLSREIQKSRDMSNEKG